MGSLRLEIEELKAQMRKYETDKETQEAENQLGPPSTSIDLQQESTSNSRIEFSHLSEEYTPTKAKSNTSLSMQQNNENHDGVNHQDGDLPPVPTETTTQ